MKRLLLAALLVAMIPSLAFAAPYVYVGELSTEDNSLIATGEWGSYGASIGWEAWQEGSKFNIVYDFNINTPEGRAEISHLIFGVSPSFNSENLLSWEVLEGTGTIEIGTWDFRGIKLDGASGNQAKIHLVSDRNFVWTDFYAKNGKAGGEWNLAWNAPGFKIIGFDTDGVPIIPAPGAFVLAAIGVTLFRRRFVN
jgi:hypothetical protein